MPDKSYCYPNTDVLINKLGIKNVKELMSKVEDIIGVKVYVEYTKGMVQLIKLKDINFE